MPQKYTLYEVVDAQGMRYGRKCLSERSCRSAFDKAHRFCKAKEIKSCTPERFALLIVAEKVMLGKLGR